MLTTLFIKGFIMGFAIAAPVGPIGILCIQQSLKYGFKIGLMTGMGAALADGVYGLVAGFGLTAVSSLLIHHQFWIRLLGGLFLIYLGIITILASPNPQAAVKKSDPSSWHACLTTFFITLTSPMTILSFIAIFASMRVGDTQASYGDASIFVTGIILGSALWWLILSLGVARFIRHRVNHHILRWISIISGLIILVFGIVSAWVF